MEPHARDVRESARLKSSAGIASGGPRRGATEFWPNFPWWYNNVAVALLAAPAVLLGGTLARGLARATALPAVG